VVVERKGRDESAEGSGVHDEKQRTKNKTDGLSSGFLAWKLLSTYPIVYFKEIHAILKVRATLI